MSVQIASYHFLGTEGYEKKNCAQAVLKAFQLQMDIPEDIIDSFKAFGGGRAPEGVCGAAFAAEFILGMLDTDDEGMNAVAYLAAQAGSAKCKEIKASGAFSCLSCVEACAKHVEESLNQLSSFAVENTHTS